ncbi:hypothetical protein Moror_17831 [Moniliophthora roreri MCA 2997]|uniref:Pali-domain-containing protein n=2 Tax=Moniliophthora roreri TaxID=221103 RepID=V2XWM5_MONRO|nr:hypothetical protein Moror_17831 [Moniliophthora roreri MCA 2997]KAI3618827.1 hypothetical protein WG66_000417 [Moniliophthora roreri]
MKPEHKPLAAHRVTSVVSVFFLLSIFVLLLLVGLSLTIIKPIYIIRVFNANPDAPISSLATELRFGVWGICASGTLDTSDSVCYGPRLGYLSYLDENLITTQLLQRFGLTEPIILAVLKSLLTVLILHLVAAGFAFVGLVPALFLASHGLTILSLVLTVVTALLTTIVFVIDLVVVLTVKNQLPKLTNNGIGVEFGNAVWMVLGAMLGAWLAVIFLSARACYCCGVRRKHLHEFEHYHEKQPRPETSS